MAMKDYVSLPKAPGHSLMVVGVRVDLLFCWDTTGVFCSLSRLDLKNCWKRTNITWLDNLMYPGIQFCSKFVLFQLTPWQWGLEYTHRGGVRPHFTKKGVFGMTPDLHNGVMANMWLECDLKVREFELQSRVYFWTNTLGKAMTSLILTPAMK